MRGPHGGPGPRGGNMGGPGGMGGMHGGHHMAPPPPPRRHYGGYGRYRGGCLGCCTYIIGAIAVLGMLLAMIF